MSFKIGDRVRVIGNGNGVNSIPHYYNIGEVVTVTSVQYLGEYCCCVNENGKKQSVSFCHLEAIEEKKAESWRIEIVPDGEKTTATLYKRGKAVKSATVKRYKGDEYSIADAADYAVQKLFEKKKKEKKFEVGARVVCVMGRNKGNKGTVLYLDGSSIGVEFDTNINGHSFGLSDAETKCKKRHGWWHLKDELKLI